MVAKAVLELVITDNGPAPIGGRAPAGVGYGEVPSGPRFTAPPQSESPEAKQADATKPATAPQSTANTTVPAASTVRPPEPAAKPAQPQPQPIVQKPEGESFAEWEKKNRAKLMAEQAAFRSAKSVERGFGEDFTTVPDKPAAPEGAGGAAAMLEGMGGLALKAGAAAAALGLVATVAVKANQSLKGLAEQSAEYSPEVAEATARSEIREMMSEMKRAQRIGPELARFEDARSRFESAMESIGTRLIELGLLIVKPLEPILNALSTIIELMMALGQPIVESLKVIVDVVTLQFGSIPGDLKNLLESITTMPDKLKKAFEDDEANLTDPFGAELDKMFNTAAPLFGRDFRPPLPRGN